MPKPLRKYLLIALVILLALGAVYIFALDEDRSTLNVIRRFLKELVRAI